MRALGALFSSSSSSCSSSLLYANLAVGLMLHLPYPIIIHTSAPQHTLSYPSPPVVPHHHSGRCYNSRLQSPPPSSCVISVVFSWVLLCLLLLLLLLFFFSFAFAHSLNHDDDDVGGPPLGSCSPSLAGALTYLTHHLTFMAAAC